ncbi:hypothetical protein CGCF413_v007820 [Colletotrichum fructicola]|nr:hypothetical protein CGCF413_v007820 [Colletotrichum fructicola]
MVFSWVSNDTSRTIREQHRPLLLLRSCSPNRSALTLGQLASGAPFRELTANGTPNRLCRAWTRSENDMSGSKRRTRTCANLYVIYALDRLKRLWTAIDERFDSRTRAGSNERRVVRQETSVRKHHPQLEPAGRIFVKIVNLVC